MTIKTLKRQATSELVPYLINAARQGKFEKRSVSGLVYRFDIRPEDMAIFPELRNTASVWLGFCNRGDGQ